MKHTCVETIAAIATPAGRGGVAIVRISGPLVLTLMQKILQRNCPPRQAIQAKIYDENLQVIDEGVAIYFSSPKSFTGEDVLELHTHGSPIITDLVLATLIQHGVRVARPGEFSERAFLNNKIDLTQAEAIADLINANSKRAARLALRSLQGEFAEQIKTINQQIIRLRIYIEAAIDFVDEEIDFLSQEKVADQLQTIYQALLTLEKNATQGSKLREGIKIVITGKPNVGKSSLINCLSEQEIAIVTDIPGTTRDVLRNHIDLDGMHLQIVDTAGLRESDDIVEQHGIERAYQELKTADIVLHLHDPAAASFELSLVPDAGHLIQVINKIDLIGETPGYAKQGPDPILKVSVLTGAGMDLLKAEIKKCIGISEDNESLFLARRRHLQAIHKACEYLNSAIVQVKQQQNSELVAYELACAHRVLGEITGEFTADDLLGEIFSSFCIGK